VVIRVDLSITRESEQGYPVVSVSGEVDVYSAPMLREELTQLIDGGANCVVVDLTDVGFLDSTGLGALVSARTAAGQAGGSLPVVCTHERILKLFTITGLDGVFQIYPSVADALAALPQPTAGG
jgi:anti-sigma B factor antagonist